MRREGRRKVMRGGGGRLKAFLVLTAVLSLALLTSCDGMIRVRGHVYELRRPGAQSRVYVDEAPAEDLSGLVAVGGAKLTLYHGDDYGKKPINSSTRFKATGESDASGGFDVGGVTAPGKFHAALVVEKPGYKPLTKIFLHDKLDHAAVVILVPDEQR